MTTYSLAPLHLDPDFRASCEALGIDPAHPYAAELLEAACEEAQFALAEGYAELYDQNEPFDA